MLQVLRCGARKRKMTYVEPTLPWQDELLCQALLRGQIMQLRATSGSMRPLIEPGDRLWVQRQPLHVADIVLVSA